ncbi:U7 snRNA-associated Sm-like protein LSm10 [Anthonomus grandis grandis]|uniref:U7 snRNA-associated Sm-like protein LSm10 n=1 Tax=Anthonomus grandis grandis TaxID=2921223 RepID=UPI0021664B85|nr:U7 snRNA-associated Sm-like protein LSm10 [Anthonomus grandis grandis]
MALVNASNSTKREISQFFNSLSGLVKNLEGRYTTVDLRNETCVTGKIVKVDGNMNIEFEDAIFYDMRGNSKPLANFFVSERNIRYVHIPKSSDALTLLKGQLESMSRKKEKKTRKFKQVRAEKRQKETLSEHYSKS